MSGSPVLYVFVAVVLLSALTWTLTPKSEHQTLIRTSVSLTLVSCYLMWAITYLAQLHPLIEPRRSDVRILAE
ncbi:hypothetical protein BOTBODRAFT_153181 [Botryobasidium botryosum FD-172 SS1]|uniref:Uncharacterized protein n=1 Tax=Botryobasidium botryosum (strain FD-172 SS1) TaxID=930990 RepID=A0A067N6A2_BOTB1|nr:hypothetical protein BOTBODRAFT_153181 [Botryobasidium botryosum FD-172 SS1]